MPTSRLTTAQRVADSLPWQPIQLSSGHDRAENGNSPWRSQSCADTSSPAQLPFYTFLHTYADRGGNSCEPQPIIDSMLPTWTFDRQGEQLIVQRDTRDGASCALIVTRGGESRTIEFAELPALVRFQSDMDTFLLRTGWLLLAYAPDRRRRDRRRFPRVTNDRRRWWTDGVEPETGPSDKERRRRSG